jgi:hypothetical protein
MHVEIAEFALRTPRVRNGDDAEVTWSGVVRNTTAGPGVRVTDVRFGGTAKVRLAADLMPETVEIAAQVDAVEGTAGSVDLGGRRGEFAESAVGRQCRPGPRGVGVGSS